jgi:hypothetical protein
MSECEPGCLCVHPALIPVAGEQGGLRWGSLAASLIIRVIGLVLFAPLRKKGGIMATATIAPSIRRLVSKPIRVSPKTPLLDFVDEYILCRQVSPLYIDQLRVISAANFLTMPKRR